MILTCPNCQTRYTIDPNKLGPSGRNVRCDNCGNTWHEGPRHGGGEFSGFAAADGGGFQLMSPASGSYGSKASVGAKARPGSPAGWVALAVVVTLGTALVVGARDDIARLWPPSTRLYQTIGMPIRVAGEGLDLQDVRPTRHEDTNSVTLEGTVINTSKKTREVPKIQAAVTTPTNQILKKWTFGAGTMVLLPGEKTFFKSELSDLPKGGSDIAVTFVEN